MCRACYDTQMESVASLIAKRVPIKDKNERRTLLNEIYAFYDTPEQDTLRRVANWRKYVRGCKRAGVKPTTKGFSDNFKKSREYIRHIDKQRIWFYLAHVKTKDLYFVRSMVHDKSNRGESIGGYLGMLIKKG